MNFTTKSGFPDLDGNMDVVNGKVTRYHSNLRGTGMVLGSQMVTNFLVKLTGVAKPYHIISDASGNKFEGTADDEDGKRKSQIETWIATATVKKPTRKSAAKSTAGTKPVKKAVGKSDSTRAALKKSIKPANATSRNKISTAGSKRG